jgi:hypothetical protein
MSGDFGFGAWKDPYGGAVKSLKNCDSFPMLVRTEDTGAFIIKAVAGGFEVLENEYRTYGDTLTPDELRALGHELIAMAALAPEVEDEQ